MTRIPYHIVLISISIFIVLFLLVGVPVSWKDGLLIGVALVLFIIGLAFRKEMNNTSSSKNADAFRDSDASMVDFEETITREDDEGIESVQIIRSHSYVEKNEQ